MMDIVRAQKTPILRMVASQYALLSRSRCKGEGGFSPERGGGNSGAASSESNADTPSLSSENSPASCLVSCAAPPSPVGCGGAPTSSGQSKKKALREGFDGSACQETHPLDDRWWPWTAVDAGREPLPMGCSRRQTYHQRWLRQHRR